MNIRACLLFAFSEHVSNGASLITQRSQFRIVHDRNSPLICLHPVKMTDWAKSKVADLKEECKSRGIPLTGLKLKQQYIDKLEEHEATQENTDPEEPGTADVIPPEETQATTPNNETPESQPNSQSQANEHTDEAKIHADKSITDQDPIPTAVDEIKDLGVQDEPVGHLNADTQHVKAQETVEVDKPVELQKEDIQAEDVHRPLDKPPVDSDPTAKKPLFIPESDQVQAGVESINTQNPEASEHFNDAGSIPRNAAFAEDQTMASGIANWGRQEAPTTIPSKPGLISSDTSTPTSSQIPVADLLDDRRNRRKRSLTPVPTSEEMARKKVRLSDAAEDAPKEYVSSEGLEATTEVTQETRDEDDQEIPLELPSQQPGNGDGSTLRMRPKSSNPGITTNKTPPASPPEVRDLSEERDVPAALHPATCSIYIRNLKRPLHIPTLRSHIVSLAQSPDPITIFFLDSVRTHAFISFTSVAAASRVRTAMHDTRFPDEAMREPLFVDYIPDDKVQSWIDEETGGNSFGGRAGGKRFEVVYEEGRHGGIEAIFQEVDARKPQPPIPRPSLTSRSIDTGRPRLESRSQDVHPERAALVSNPTQYDRPPPARPSEQSRPNNSGVGFKALDDLFPSTTTKPKLYFKPVPDDVVQDRINMLRHLRVDYSEMGRSGDEGMKRYSFELFKSGREEWVDKGPEFGFGRKGQDRLTGFRGRGGGGYRGRGGDSWRGGR